MKEIKKVTSNYISYAELCELASRDSKFTANILLKYDIAEDQWYLKHRKNIKKVKKESIEKYFSNNKLKIVKQSKITNVLNKAS